MPNGNEFGKGYFPTVFADPVFGRENYRGIPVYYSGQTAQTSYLAQRPIQPKSVPNSPTPTSDSPRPNTTNQLKDEIETLAATSPPRVAARPWFVVNCHNASRPPVWPSQACRSPPATARRDGAAVANCRWRWTWTCFRFCCCLVCIQASAPTGATTAGRGAQRHHSSSKPNNSATPSSSPATATDASSLPSGGVSGVAAVGSGSSGHNVDAAATGANHPGGQERANTANAIVVEGDEAPSGDEDEPDGKRQKRCTSGVWKYFTKKKLVTEDNGKVYIQKWAHCNYPKCKHKARCEGNYGTTEGHHTGAKLSETFTELMVKWNIDKKLFALTLDNASTNEVAVKDIISDLRTNSSASSLVCDGLFFRVRCACHILNLVARDGLSVITPTIENIRHLVLAIKGSPLQWEELMKRATECGLDTNKGLSLDVSTRWNSTYLMLRDALYYKNAFMRLKSSDRRRYENITPSPSEWAMAFKLFQCLKKFFDLTELFSSTLYPTANMFYRGFCEIKIMLDEWSLSQDNTICTMATSMSMKFEKYWKKSSITLVVACFLDPRYKKRLIEFYMRKFHGNASHVHVDELVDVIKKLYQFYVHDAPMSSGHKGKSNAPSDMEIDTADLLVDNGDEELESYMYESSGPNSAEMNELDKYMADPPLRLSGQFDVLAWWKNQTDEYPALSRIAHDFLVVQVFTVASESAFSAGGRVVDPFRNRLEPEIVEALICLKDWIAAGRREKKVGSIVCDLEVIEALVKKLTIEDDDVADSDGEMDAHGSGSAANEHDFYGI
ncbi:Unknown protein [Striga hermonthica]|uniref:Transposase n=1 Tax=Striga hermonthica TaxID=68872 RepID=A0A9N7RG88_STRHE|nr:Unknown protein [Striga hermonthica]